MAALTALRSVFAASVAAGAAAGPALAVCCPFPPVGGSLEATAQTNLVRVNEAAGEITVIPNVGLVGEGRTFSLVVPTPALPELASVPVEIWDDTGVALRPRLAGRESDDDAFGCGTETEAIPAAAPEDGGVVILGHERVGAFDATFLTAGSATALVDWLTANAYAYTAGDSAAFAPYVARDWVFTAMKLDTTAVELPPAPWRVQLDPVAITFAATTLEVPLPILAVNRSPRFDLTFVVVADRRMSLAGFRTRYANRLSAGELASMREEAPIFAGYLDTGRFVVQLHRAFVPTDDMSESILLRPDASDEEVVPSFAFRGAVPAGPVLLVVIAAGAHLAARRRRVSGFTTGLRAD